MQISDLEVFRHVPYYFWAKDAEGTYVWGNQRMCEYAGCEISGKTDYDISSPDIAERLRENDKKVLANGSSMTFYEQVNDPKLGTVTVSVCKYVDELEGRNCVFGVSFVVE